MLSGFSFASIFTTTGMAKLGQIIVGDLTMAGDNVVIMGSLASGLPERDRKRVLMLGVGMALGFLITFAVLATQLLKITGLVFAGGLLLLWVAYNMWHELHPDPACHRGRSADRAGGGAAGDQDLPPGSDPDRHCRSQHEPRQCVAGGLDRAREPGVAVRRAQLLGAVHGACGQLCRPLIQRYHWINYIGLAVILYVGINMIYEGWVGGEHVLGLRNVFGLP
jgi:predicted tellurium resistance membrane protein TerC